MVNSFLKILKYLFFQLFSNELPHIHSIISAGGSIMGAASMSLSPILSLFSVSFWEFWFSYLSKSFLCNSFNLSASWKTLQPNTQQKVIQIARQQTTSPRTQIRTMVPVLKFPLSPSSKASDILFTCESFMPISLKLLIFLWDEDDSISIWSLSCCLLLSYCSTVILSLMLIPCVKLRHARSAIMATAI